jgi:tetratricopeptide (TPR) repeat protein
MSITQLVVDAHHRGGVLVAKTITPPYVSNGIITIIEDDYGNVTKLTLYHQDHTLATSILPEHSTVAIKEPYFRFDGDNDYTVQVDHPSDILILTHDPVLNEIIQLKSSSEKQTSQLWQQSGDQAYLQKHYLVALECYSEAIQSAQSENRKDIHILFHKRANVNIVIKRFEAARNDALASCSGASKADSKAHFCAGRAAYELGLFEESRDHFSDALKQSPDSAVFRSEFRRAEDRLKEQRDGDYDFEVMCNSVTHTRNNLDHADFFSATEVKNTKAHGRGLFATRFIPAGSLVMVEKALVLPNKYGSREVLLPNSSTRSWNDEETLTLYNVNNNAIATPSQSQCFASLVRKLHSNPSITSQFFGLDSGGYVRSGGEGDILDEVPIIDVFLVEAIRLRNCFSSPRRSNELMKKNFYADNEDLSTGLWVRSAYLNHSCIPNCSRSFIGDMQIIRACRDIEAGEELTHQYISPEAILKSRQDLMQKTWEFQCDCDLCTIESKSPDSAHQARRELSGKVRDKATARNGNNNDNKNKSTISARNKDNAADANLTVSRIKAVERLFRSLENLHEPTVYANIPRLILIHPSIYLAEAYRAQRNYKQTVKWCMEVLRNYGFINPLREVTVESAGGDNTNGTTSTRLGLVLDRSVGLTNSETVNILMVASDAWEALGEKELVQDARKEVEIGYKIITGCSVGLKEYLRREW